MSLPIYLFTGTEVGERNIAVAKIKEALTKQYGALDLHSNFIQLFFSPLQDSLLFVNK